MGNKYLIKLYITGHTSKSERAISNLYQICDEIIPGQYEITIIDVLERPNLAEEDKIIATPTLIKYLPPPARRVIGDLTDKNKVIAGLDLHIAGEERIKG
jgi:circadian clock protein KaiB